MGNLLVDILPDENSCKRVKDWIEENDIMTQLNKIRSTFSNSKGLFNKIIIPDGLI